MPAYIPPLWYKMMNERVIKHYQGDLSKLNMNPKIKPKLLKKAERMAGKIADRFKTEH